MNNEKDNIKEYLNACESQLDNVLSSPIGTGDYSLPSADEVDETVFMEDEIEATNDLLDFFEDDDNVVKDFFGIK